MDQRNLSRLEFDKVKQKLASFATSDLARETIADLKPLKGVSQIRDRLAETTEGTELLRLDPTAPLGGWQDIRAAIKHCQRSGLLEPQELWHVLQTAAAARRSKVFFQQKKDFYPRLWEIAQGLADFKTLEKNISHAILPGGEISDRATDTLFHIRRKLVNAKGRIQERLDQMIRSPHYQKYLQDPIVTMRQGRYVVPVKQEYKSQVPGIVHDSSASGATLFIEPMPVVEANNEVRRLLAAEKEEIARLLQELSAQVSQQGEQLWYTLEVLGSMDFIMAKAHYSKHLDAIAPGIVPQARLNIINGRHPLLPGKPVPVSLHIGDTFDLLIVTGPNTGGKTVTLKTVGLMVAMAQAGLHVPADGETTIGMFDQIYVDIGDEQSIEQSLSTFSSHMSNIVHILEQVQAHSLVLLDELGAGTDPTEGAALAQAILDQLLQTGARAVATTHYGELKNYAYANPRVENASVDFDPQTLRPTYKLLIGRPGRSNAFEIASRLGLKEEVVQRAATYLTEEQLQEADLMRQLEKARAGAEKELEQARQLRHQAQQDKEQYQKQLAALRKRQDDMLAKATTQASEIVKKARNETDYLLAQFKTQLKQTSARVSDAPLHEIKRQLAGLQADLQQKAPSASQAPAPGGRPLTQVQPGDQVFLTKFGQQGVVLDVLEKDKLVQVQVGAMRLNVPLKELSQAAEGTSRPVPGPSKTMGGLMQQKAKDISSQLDLRGMRVEQALEKVGKYLDDAALAGLSMVYLVHGKGTGALRTAVQQMLKTHPLVKEFRLGEHGEGDTGVTVVKM